jgi:8-hydroxy-5-deazaflavin:NADPH oxidoreductase
MQIAILGTGIVGTTFAHKLGSLGHEVHLGTRDPAAALARKEPGPMGRPPFATWAEQHPTIRIEQFADAAKSGEVVMNCTAGTGSLEALGQAGAANLRGKILIDVSNPLDFSKGMPPRLAICNDDSLGETIQRAFPEVRVVKSLNTMNCSVMVDPSRVPGDHDVFVAGNDPGARAQVAGWLKEWFGWKAPIDLGDITAARGLEAWLPLWIRLWGALGTGDFNLKVQR